LSDFKEGELIFYIYDSGLILVIEVVEFRDFFFKSILEGLHFIIGESFISVGGDGNEEDGSVCEAEIFWDGEADEAEEEGKVSKAEVILFIE